MEHGEEKRDLTELTSYQMIRKIANDNEELYNKLLELKKTIVKEYNEQLDKHIDTFKYFQNH